jgi:hypothetical protein
VASFVLPSLRNFVVGSGDAGFDRLDQAELAPPNRAAAKEESRDRKAGPFPPAPPAPKRRAPAASGAVRGRSPGAPPALTVLSAKVVLRKGDRLVLEIDAGSGLEWSVPTEVVLVFADGSTQRATVDARATTCAGTLAPGQTARLALRVSGASGASGASGSSPVRIEVTGASGAVTIALDA